MHLTYGSHAVLIELPGGVQCAACDHFSFFLWNVYGRTLCSVCAVAWRNEIEAPA